jgi:hypothetical protein
MQNFINMILINQIIVVYVFVLLVAPYIFVLIHLVNSGDILLKTNSIPINNTYTTNNTTADVANMINFLLSNGTTADIAALIDILFANEIDYYKNNNYTPPHIIFSLLNISVINSRIISPVYYENFTNELYPYNIRSKLFIMEVDKNRGVTREKYIMKLSKSCFQEDSVCNYRSINPNDEFDLTILNSFYDLLTMDISIPVTAPIDIFPQNNFTYTAEIFIPYYTVHYNFGPIKYDFDSQFIFDEKNSNYYSYDELRIIKTITNYKTKLTFEYSSVFEKKYINFSV